MSLSRHPARSKLAQSEFLSDVPKFCLIVDASAAARESCARILKSLNFAIAEAESGSGAIEACRLISPDLIVLDWNMPVLDGISCLRVIRGMRLGLRPAIIMCTDEFWLPDIREALDAGADEYMIKPFDRDLLHDKLTHLDLI